MSRVLLLIAVAMGFCSVALGAFAAHGLETIVSVGMLAVFKTGVQYQMFHVTALVIVALLSHGQPESRLLKISGYLFVAGIILFSGSLYLLSITGISTLGIITPVGGLAFLLAWGLLFIHVFKHGISNK